MGSQSLDYQYLIELNQLRWMILSHAADCLLTKSGFISNRPLVIGQRTC